MMRLLLVVPLAQWSGGLQRCMIRMNIPKGLDMTSWWLRAACKGLLFESLHVTHCYDCPVQQECLWSAIDVDDRLVDEPLLIRGGLSPINRGAIWFKHKPDTLQVFMYSRMKATEQEAHYRKQVKESKQTS
jgi:hypothetical protein